MRLKILCYATATTNKKQVSSVSLESRVLQLQAKHKALDEAFLEYHKIVAGTQDVVSLILKEQREYHGKTDYRLDSIKRSLEAFKDETCENFKQLQLLITQLHPTIKRQPAL